MATLDTEDAAGFLKIHPETFCRLARAGKVPAAKVGRSWVAIDVDLEAYIRSKYAPKEDGEWGSTGGKDAASGGTSSSSRAAAYRKALAPATVKRPNRSKPGTSASCGKKRG
jgi:hypothetical protein